MNSEYWSRYFVVLGNRLLRGSPYPALGIATGQALLDPDASLVGCSATAAGILLFIGGLSGACICIAWLLKDWPRL